MRTALNLDQGHHGVLLHAGDDAGESIAGRDVQVRQFGGRFAHELCDLMPLDGDRAWTRNGGQAPGVYPASDGVVTDPE